MKQITIIFILVLSCSLIFGAHVAMLSAAKGKVELKRSGQALRFKTGELLQNNDEVRTGGESFAAYKYVDGSSTIKIFSNSVIKIQANTSGKSLVKKVNVSKGSIFTKIKPKSGTFIVQTPTTVASVKGTGFLTKITAQKQSMFVVTEGEVVLKILDDTETKAVSAGKTAVVEADGRYDIRQSTPEDLSAIELAEIESTSAKENKIMRIPVVDPSGRIRYIEITY